MMADPPQVRDLTIALAGDVMTGRGIDQVLRTPSDPVLYESYLHDARDYVHLAERVNGAVGRGLADEALWDSALQHLERLAPAAFVVNLETAVTTSNTPWPGKGIHYRMHPANLGCLKPAGVRLCTLANNHVLDWGRAGLEETLRCLREQGLLAAGAGADAAQAWAPARVGLDGGMQLHVLACATTSSGVPESWAATQDRSGVALLPDLSTDSAQRVADILAPLRGGRARTMVSIHWGANWVPRVPDEHRRFAHRLIDLGAADIVHGHSSHHPLPIEVYRGRLILYGCGDLINDYEGIDARGAQRADGGALYAATLDAEGGALRALRIVPLQRRRFRLQAPDTATREWLQTQFLAGRAPWQAQVQMPGGGPDWQLHWDGPSRGS
jgi:poly-gamma-glutamate synthesis protein (capsule biosynthesis protein)